MSVYKNDNPKFVKSALDSIINQTFKPSEIILMIDGPVSDELKEIIIVYSNNYQFIKPQWQEKNTGLGNVLHKGLLLCENEFVARMDADDIAAPDRFEKQIDFLKGRPDIAVLGGQISEFIDSEKNIIGYRTVPLSPEECRKYYQDRDPLNHMTVMFRKSAVLAVGNYLPWHLDEDTYLWGRLLKAGYNLGNLPDTLVNVRVGKEMYARRGGWKYFKSDSKILRWKLENNLSSKSRFLYNYLIRFIIQVLMPNSARGWIFKNMLRNRN